MKSFFKTFFLRGSISAWGGPLVLAIIYGCLGASGTVEAFTPGEVCTGILSVTLMAFVAAGITVVYHVEKLPLPTAILIHGAVLYLTYLASYLLNSWIPRNGQGIGIFSLFFVLGYLLVWLCIWLSIRYKTKQLNQKLNE